MAVSKNLQAPASVVGLFIVSYNPGDNLTYKILTADVDYFSADSSLTLFVCHKASEVRAFLDGFGCGQVSRQN